MARIIRFPDEKIEYLFIHVSIDMLKGLITACYKETSNIPFTKCDLEGAFVPLYKNGFISVRKASEHGKSKHVWFITNLGKKALGERNISQVMKIYKS